jgi:membrane-bound serine protease (ClpP class)
MDNLFWILLVFAAGMVAMFIELLVPGVVMGILGFLAVCGSIAYAYMNGHPVAGTTMLGCLIVFVPVFFVIWKHVLGKVWAIRETEKDFHASTTHEENLLGKEGQAASRLRPSGIALIEGKRHAVITRGEMLEKGTPVKVIEVSGNRITVKKA